MAIENPRVATAIAGGFVLGVALQFLVRAPVRGVSAPLLAVLAARHPSYLHLPMQGCILWHNWWPMLTGREVCIGCGFCSAGRSGVGMRVVRTCGVLNLVLPIFPAFMYVLVPMPALFFGGVGGTEQASCRVDAGQIRTGF